MPGADEKRPLTRFWKQDLAISSVQQERTQEWAEPGLTEMYSGTLLGIAIEQL